MTETTQAPVAMATEIAEYSATAAALGELRSKYENVLFPVETTKGMKDAVAARRELRELRTGLERSRKEIKEPALRRCQMIDSEAKEITRQLTALEEPIDAQIKAEESRKEQEKAERERIERERVAVIRAKIDGISRLALDSASDTADEIMATIDDLGSIEVGEDFAEFKAEAEAAKAAAMTALTVLHQSAKAREEEAARLKAEAERLAEEREAMEARRRAEEEERAQRQREEQERIEAEERRLAAERAELERQRAELDAAKKAQEAPAPADPAPIDTTTSPVTVVDTVATEAHDVNVTVGVDPAAPGGDETVVTEPGFQIVADGNSEAMETQNADDLVAELAHYTAMQFNAIAKKVRAIVGKDHPFADELDDVAYAVSSGEYNDAIKAGNWLAMADADKEMALAAHACVSLIVGDEDMGASVLREVAA